LGEDWSVDEGVPSSRIELGYISKGDMPNGHFDRRPHKIRTGKLRFLGQFKTLLNLQVSVEKSVIPKTILVSNIRLAIHVGGEYRIPDTEFEK